MESMGVVVWRYNYIFPHITYPYSSSICSFLQHHPYFFCSFLKCYFIYGMVTSGSVFGFQQKPG